MSTAVGSSVRRRVRSLFRRDRPEYASVMSLLACTVLAAGSIALGAVQHSLTVQTNGYISLIDIGNSLLFLAAVQRSTRSADVTFNYGYGKYESLAILASAALLLVLVVLTLGEAFTMISERPDAGNTLLLSAWSVTSFFVMRTTARLLERYATRFHMPMLRYDAELWRVDSWVEVAVFCGIVTGGLLHLAGFGGIAAVIDVVAAIGLIIVTVKVPLTHGREALQQLLDRTLPDEQQYEILAIISENVGNMCAFNGVHTRRSGKDIFIEIDLVMPYDYSLERLYDLERGILSRLRGTFPTAIPRVYVTPCDRSCNHDGVSSCPVKSRLTAHGTE